MNKEEIKGYNLYKGLKKPLMFKGLKGKYIYHAAGAFVGTMILGITLSKLLGLFLGLITTIIIGGGSFWKIFKNQKTKGLYNKKRNHNQIHLIPKRIKLKQ